MTTGRTRNDSRRRRRGSRTDAYYSAAVKSMTGSFSNFLFGSFDPYGVVTVDKPPMSLWPQALSVMIFGFHGWSLLLPQVIEGVAAVFLLHRTVRMWAGENTALLAAAILALTPITVAINRDNNPDTLLVLLLVAAAYAFTRSVRTTVGTRWLLLCAFLIGCGFLTKMLQAWIIVPGIALAYFVGTSAPVKRRVLDLLGAGGVLIASSFWWVALHEWWPGDKPYIGGSDDGGELRFVLSGSGGGFMGQLTGTNHTQERHEWIERHCEKVDPSAYGGSTDSQEQGAGLMGAQTLYDCRS